jgi:hypothetical protein
MNNGNPYSSGAGFASMIVTNDQPQTSYSYHGGSMKPPGGLMFNGAFNYATALPEPPQPTGSPVHFVGCGGVINDCADPYYNYNMLLMVANSGAASYLKFTPYTNVLQLVTAALDLSAAPLYNATVKSPANGTAAALNFSSLDSGGVSHGWTVSAPVTSGGYTLTLPQKSGTFAMTSDVVTPPVFGASGSGHATGLVPDPGTTTGSTRYLREDGNWVAPAGGGGFPVVVAHASLSGQTGAVSNIINYTPTVDGTFRLTATLYLTAACTAGTIQVQQLMYPVSGHNTFSSSNLTCTTPFTSVVQTQTYHSIAGQAILSQVAFSGVTGSPVYNVDVVLEQLQ